MNYLEFKKDCFGEHPEYGVSPFWFWNDDLDNEKIKEQILDFKEKGVSGFVIHPRIGVPKEIPFLGERYIGHMKFAIELAEELGMYVILYDEAMYPSGSGGGEIVRRNPELASKTMKLKTEEAKGDLKAAYKKLLDDNKDLNIEVVQLASFEFGKLLPKSVVILDNENDIDKFENKTEDSRFLIFHHMNSGCTIRGIHFGEDCSDPDAPMFADIMCLDATKSFLNIVYETYYKHFGKYFGNVIQGIFTDEPRHVAKKPPKDGVAFTPGFMEYVKGHGFKLEDLGLLFLEGEGKLKAVRDYARITSRRLLENYFIPLADWCNSKGTVLCGHPSRPDDMAQMNVFGLPTQDIVWRWVDMGNENAIAGHESTCGKATSDTARHNGYRRNANEVLGAFRWQLSSINMKWVFDWLFLRGCNMIQPHAFYYSLSGKRFMEAPPDVGNNSLWWPYYKKLSDYIKFMSYLNTDSINLTNVAVLCDPDYAPYQIARVLFQNQIEYNFLEKSLFTDKAKVGKQIEIAKQKYDILVIENTFKLDEKTDKKISEFVKAGGKVFFVMGSEKDFPHFCSYNYDMVPTDCTRVISNESLAEELKYIYNGKAKLMQKNEFIRITELEKDGNPFYILGNEDVTTHSIELLLKNEGAVEVIDSTTREPLDVPTCLKEGYVSISLDIYDTNPIVIFVDKSKPFAANTPKEFELIESKALTLLSQRDEKDGDGFPLYTEYTYEFTADGFDKVTIDCCKANEFTAMDLNGEFVDALMWKPFIYDISGVCKKGKNEVKIKVYNNLINKYGEKEAVVLKKGMEDTLKISYGINEDPIVSVYKNA